MSTNDWLAIAGLVIIVALAAYAWFLWRRVWQAQHRRDAVASQSNELLEQDIRFLAQSMLNGQLPFIEGSIRIKVLLDNYTGPRREGLEVGVFEQIYDATAHIPTHQGWKDLGKAERELHQRTMETLERDHKEEVEHAARQLSEGLK